jgi:hypothetical protein
LRNKLITVIMIVLATALFSADKFAVIIAGNYNPTNVPSDQLWNNGQGDYSEFWNDLYLQWEMLYQKGYAKENITVIFADGIDMWQDYDFSYIATRYRAEYNTRILEETITNHSATKGNIQAAVTTLKTKIGPDDFLYVWAMSHGGTSTQSGLYFNDGLMTDAEFAGLFNTITANKKVFVINANYAQGFKDKFTGTSVRVEIPSMNTKTLRADDKAAVGGTVIPFLENEKINDRFITMESSISTNTFLL